MSPYPAAGTFPAGNYVAVLLHQLQGTAQLRRCREPAPPALPAAPLPRPQPPAGRKDPPRQPLSMKPCKDKTNHLHDHRP